MKHLIYLIDGTWMWPAKTHSDLRHSNIHRLNSLLSYQDKINDRPQVIHYSRGLGSGNLMMKLPAGAFGVGIWNDIEEIYLNICSNYRKGDKIYIFGFSRGAIIARVVAGLVNIGLLDSNKLDYIGFIRNAYIASSRQANRLPLRRIDIESLSAINGIIHEHSQGRAIAIEFLGLFDSVLGGRKTSRLLQELNVVDNSPAENVNSVVHLLALDEGRAMFKPSPFSRLEKKNLRHFEQIWFPGVHGDIGGGYPENHLANLALLTMVDRAMACTDLSFDLELLPDCSHDTVRTVIHEEMELRWMLTQAGMLFRRIKRYPIGHSASLHQSVHMLKRTLHVYKRRKTKQLLVRDYLDAKIPVAPLFISNELKGRSIRV